MSVDVAIPWAFAIYVTVVVAAVIFVLWRSASRTDVAIKKAGEQRARLLSLILKHEDWRDLSEDMDDVTFEDHWRAVRRNRDWRTLYSRRLQSLMAEREARKNGDRLQ